jgi:hypothetical protein
MNILPEHKLLISDVRQNGSGPDTVAMTFDWAWALQDLDKHSVASSYLAE